MSLDPCLYGEMLEINITDDCQLKCKQCNRLCDVAPSKDCMPVDMVVEMCKQIPHMKRICIAGGEPMLHPSIGQIVEIITDANVADKVLLLTNGIDLAPYADELGKKYGVEVWNSGKRDKPPEHTLLTTVSPVDVGLWGAKKGKCDILSRCGLGYSTGGYYPCCISAAIGRVFGIKGAVTFEELTTEKYNELIELTCRHCGYYLTSKENTILPEFDYPREMVSVSWEDAIAKYKHDRGEDAK